MSKKTEILIFFSSFVIIFILLQTFRSNAAPQEIDIGTCYMTKQRNIMMCKTKKITCYVDFQKFSDKTKFFCVKNP